MREIYKKYIAPALPENFSFKLKFYSKHGYWPNLKRPRSLMEKIVWLLRNDRTPLRADVVDRIKVRSYVESKAPDCKMPELLWFGVNFTEEVWISLPEKFVIKGNHGSQMTKLVDKRTDSYESVRELSQKWLDVDYSAFFGEWVYAHAQRVLVVEEFLQFEAGVPPDWKFMCGNGHVMLVQLDLGRFGNHKRNLYDRDFKIYKDATLARLPNGSTEKPLVWDKAISIAERLSAPFDFIRVDLYMIGPHVYFGELTNYPGAGMDLIRPKALDFEIGRKFNLNGF